MPPESWCMPSPKTSKFPLTAGLETDASSKYGADRLQTGLGSPASGNTEIARFDLSEDGSAETAMVFGEIYRNGADWKFKAIGQGFKGGLGPLAASFGVGV